jgi:D-alanyl-lipoteichoic acid acyltransferase DltB (MBOAT superfamily)
LDIFFLNKQKYTVGAKYWLIFASLFFYSWWNVVYLPLMILSIVVNYFLTTNMQNQTYKKNYLLFGLIFNIGLLCYFKYADFFISNINFISGSEMGLLHLALPLAISFFTLQQIAFLVDSYGGLVKERSFVDYSLFVVFFPQLIAGPIVHHKEMMPQFATMRNKLLNYDNIARGLFVFSIGLFKKVVIADTFAQWASAGFASADKLNLIEGWVTSLSYTFQLYFDFSGYTDMAIGIALLFNIRLPQNFNSPYKSTSIIEFWNRWHMTLTRFLTTYIYEPIVKSFGKFSFNRAMFATFVTMFIAGLWHGAAWTFVIFGALHGGAIVINHYWKKSKNKLPKVLAWFLAFNFLNLTLVIFRASSIQSAFEIIKGMFGFHSISTITEIGVNSKTILYIVLSFLVILLLKNSNEMLKNFKPSLYNLIFSIVLLFISLSMISNVSEFLYFNF